MDRANHLGEPVARRPKRRAALAAALAALLLAAAGMPAIAQDEPALEVVPRASRDVTPAGHDAGTGGRRAAPARGAAAAAARGREVAALRAAGDHRRRHLPRQPRHHPRLGRRSGAGRPGLPPRRRRGMALRADRAPFAPHVPARAGDRVLPAAARPGGRGDRPLPGRADRPRRMAPAARAGARPTTTPPRNTGPRRSRAAATVSACGREPPPTGPARRAGTEPGGFGLDRRRNLRDTWQKSGVARRTHPGGGST